MSDTLIAPKYDLTADDLKMIVAVCEETAKHGSPIALIRGPETMEALRPWFPTNQTWANLQRLGTQKRVGNKTRADTPSGRPTAIYTKRVEYQFHSPRWPKGIPVGVYDIETQRELESDDMKKTSSTSDITWGEEQRILFMSEGKIKPTDRQIREDTNRKEALRNKRHEDESLKTPEQRAAETLVDALRKAGLVPTPAAPTSPAQPKAGGR